MSAVRDQTRDIFDIIGTYFVNTYWFPLYKHAHDAFSERQFPNLPDGYKVIVDRYRVAFCTAQDSQGRENPNYSKIINDVKNNYNTWLQTDLSLGDFIDIVCRQIIPGDVYKTLGRQDNRKDELFRKAITQSVTNFTVYVATEGLADVINDRGPTAKQKMALWKEEFIRILYNERDELYGRFMATKSGVSSRKANHISREAFDKMTEQIKKLIFEKAKIQKSLNMFVFAAKKQQEVDAAKIAELTAMLGAGAGRGRAPARFTPVLATEPVSSDETFSEEESSEDGSKLPKINNPAGDDFLKKGNDLDKSITAPLDDVPEYSGEDFEQKDAPVENSSEESSSEMSMDE
jgi:hypothetical protein